MDWLDFQRNWFCKHPMDTIIVPGDIQSTATVGPGYWNQAALIATWLFSTTRRTWFQNKAIQCIRSCLNLGLVVIVNQPDTEFVCQILNSQ